MWTHIVDCVQLMGCAPEPSQGPVGSNAGNHTARSAQAKAMTSMLRLDLNRAAMASLVNKFKWFVMKSPVYSHSYRHPGLFQSGSTITKK